MNPIATPMISCSPSFRILNARGRFLHGTPALTCQVHLPMGSWFVDGNIFMKSGVYLNGRCVRFAIAV